MRIGRDAQTRLFAGIDLAVNLLSLATQVFVTGQLLKRFGSVRRLFEVSDAETMLKQL